MQRDACYVVGAHVLRSGEEFSPENSTYSCVPRYSERVGGSSRASVARASHAHCSSAYPFGQSRPSQQRCLRRRLRLRLSFVLRKFQRHGCGLLLQLVGQQQPPRSRSTCNNNIIGGSLFSTNSGTITTSPQQHAMNKAHKVMTTLHWWTRTTHYCGSMLCKIIIAIGNILGRPEGGR